MAQGQRLNPAARDAAVRRIAVITTGVVTLGLAGTVGLGVAIAAGIPEKDTAVDTSVDTASEEVVVGEEPAPATVPAGTGAGTETGADTGAVPVPTQQKNPAAAPTQQKKTTPAPKPRTTTKPPQTQSGGS